MRVRLRRPRYQRSVRLLLSFALLVPAAGIVQAFGADEVGLAAAVTFLSLAAVSAYDAWRHVVVVTRHGIGIAGRLGVRTTWLAWPEIVHIDVTDAVVSLTTRDRAIHQLQLDRRVAQFIGRMVERQIVGRAGR